MNDLLGLIAELAVGFTGFAAISSALGHSPSEADLRLDRVRLRNLVEVGVFTVLMALLPRLLSEEGAEPMVTWGTSGVAFFTLGSALAVVHIRRARALKVTALVGYSRSGHLMTYALGLSALGLLAMSFVIPWIPVDRAYAGALFLALAMVGVYFVRVAASLLTHRVQRQPE